MALRAELGWHPRPGDSVIERGEQRLCSLGNDGAWRLPLDPLLDDPPTFLGVEQMDGENMDLVVEDGVSAVSILAGNWSRTLGARKDVDSGIATPVPIDDQNGDQVPNMAAVNRIREASGVRRKRGWNVRCVRHAPGLPRCRMSGGR